VRALIDGAEARLGSPGFCGLEEEVAHLGALAPDVSLVAFRHGARHALFQLRQTLRCDAAQTLAALARRGLAMEILSGDRAEAVESVAKALRCRQLAGWPETRRKGARIEALRAAGHKVLMVGDGLTTRRPSPALTPPCRRSTRRSSRKRRPTRCFWAIASRPFSRRSRQAWRRGASCAKTSRSPRSTICSPCRWRCSGC